MSEFTKSDISQIVNSIISSMESKPLRLGVIGTSGVGKSSTINALFGSNLEISHTVACTKEFTDVPIDVELNVAQKNRKTLLHVVDAPGLGESLRTDIHYLSRYREELPTCDGVLWILAARNRGLALDQTYLEQLSGHFSNVVFGVNQVDMIDPLDWNYKINLPSKTQSNYIEEIVRDRKEKIEEIVSDEVVVIPYSAERKYNLSVLFAKLIESLPIERRAPYDLIRSFKVEDQFPKEVLEALADANSPRQNDTRNKVKNFLKQNILPRKKQ